MAVIELKPDQVERLARALHDIFCENLIASGYRYGAQRGAREHEALVPYDDLPLESKQQNLEAACAMPEQLARGGFELTEFVDEDSIVTLTRTEIVRLATIEHLRWARLKRRQGWSRGATLDRANKKHPLLVPWRRLAEPQQKKDRLKFDALPGLLAREGLVIVRRSPRKPEELAEETAAQIEACVADVSLADAGLEPAHGNLPPRARLTTGYGLRVGVVGPVQLAEVGPIRAAIERELDTLEQPLRGASDAVVGRLVAVSSLAPGTDRLVVDAILRRHGSHQVVLPFAWPEYASLLTADERAEGLKLLRLAETDPLFHDERRDTPHELRLRLRATGALVELHGGEALPRHASKLTSAFAEAGFEVVEASEVVLAVWNEHHRGVTAAVVEYALERGKPVLTIDPAAPSAAARWLRTSPARGRWSWDPHDVDDLPRAVGGFRRAARLFDERFWSPGHVEDRLKNGYGSRAHLLEIAARHHLPIEPVNDCLRHLHAVHGWTDAAAQQCKRLHKVLSGGVFVFTALAFIAAALRAVFFHDRAVLTALEIDLMALAFGAFWLAHTTQQHSRWTQYRALAERTRTAVFSLLTNEPAARVGTHCPVVRPLDRPSLGWVDIIYEDLVARAPRNLARYAHWKWLRGFVVEAWLADQAIWQEKRAHKLHARHLWSEIAVAVIFGAIIAIALNHARHHTPGRESRLDDLATFACLSLPVLGAAIHAIVRHFEIARLAGRCKQYALAIRREISRIQDARSDDEFRTCVRRAAAMLDGESLDWTTVVELTRPTLAT